MNFACYKSFSIDYVNELFRHWANQFRQRKSKVSFCITTSFKFCLYLRQI